MNIVSAEYLFGLGTNRSTGTSTKGTSSRTDGTAISGSGEGTISTHGVGSGHDGTASSEDTSSGISTIGLVVPGLSSVFGDSHQVGLGSMTKARLRSTAVGQGPVVVLGLCSIVMERDSGSRSFLKLTLSVVRDDLTDTNSADTSTDTSSDGVTDPGSGSLLVGSSDGTSSAWGSNVLGLVDGAVSDRLVVGNLSHRLSSRGGSYIVGLLESRSGSGRSGPRSGSWDDAVVDVLTAVRGLSVGSSRSRSLLLSDRSVLGWFLLVGGHDRDLSTGVGSGYPVARSKG